MNRTSNLRSMRRSTDGNSAVGLQGGFTNSESDTWPPPGGGPVSDAKADAASKVASEKPKVKHRTRSLTFELMLPIKVEPQFLVTPFAGGGVTVVKAKDPGTNNFTLEDNTMPVMTYGLSASAHFGGFVVMAQYKTFVFFPSKLRYQTESPTLAQDFDLAPENVGTVTSSALTVGIGRRF